MRLSSTNESHAIQPRQIIQPVINQFMDFYNYNNIIKGSAKLQIGMNKKLTHRDTISEEHSLYPDYLEQ